MAEEKLIEAVKAHKELYDTKDANYLKSKLKNRIWDNIANKLNLKDGEEAKTVWFKLRGSHRDALRRQLRYMKSGTGPENMKLWRFQKQMSFLEPYMSIGLREGNVNESDDDLPLPPIGDEILDNPEVNEGNTYERERSEQANVVDTNRDNSGESCVRTESTSATSRQSKKRKLDDISVLLMRSIQQREERSQQRAEERYRLQSRDTLTNDPLYNFFLSMYQLTKKMPPNYQRQVRSTLFEAVSQAEEEIKNYRPPSTYSSFSQYSDSEQKHQQHVDAQDSSDQPGFSYLEN